MSQPQPPGPPRRSHALELLVGALLGGIDTVVTGALGVTLAANTSNGAWGFVPLVVGLLIPVGMLLHEVTRWWGLGILIGYFLALIILGGACVAIISSFSG